LISDDVKEYASVKDYSEFKRSAENMKYWRDSTRTSTKQKTREEAEKKNKNKSLSSRRNALLRKTEAPSLYSLTSVLPGTNPVLIASQCAVSVIRVYR